MINILNRTALSFGKVVGLLAILAYSVSLITEKGFVELFLIICTINYLVIMLFEKATKSMDAAMDN